MSRIFDALQQLVAEQSPGELQLPLPPAELLQVTERRKAAAQTTTVLGREPCSANQSIIADSEAVVPPAASEQTVAHVPFQTASAAEDVPPGPFSHFQSFQVFVPPQSRLVCITDRESLAAEKFRYLTVRLFQLREKRPVKKVLVTSRTHQEGKSLVAANLACALGRGKPERVLLLDGDLRRPSLARLFELGKATGMCECLQGEASPSRSIYYLEGADCCIMPAGKTPQNPLELMHSPRLPALLEQLTAWFDWIVIDSPPVLPLASGSVWMRHADGALLVAREGTTEKDQLKRCLEAIEPSKLLGTILNCSSSTAHEEYNPLYRPSAFNASEAQWR